MVEKLNASMSENMSEDTIENTIENQSTHYDVIIIGAGPSGSVAAAILQRRGYRVCMVERSRFPRFCIGESLLPQCMEFLEHADLLDVVLAAAERCGFQLKTGAQFVRADKKAESLFSSKSTAGWATTYQVRRAEFDNILAQEVASRGVDILWNHEVVAVDLNARKSRVGIRHSSAAERELTTSFVLDASGFGRVLPRLLNLDRPSEMEPRVSIFTHIEDNLVDNIVDNIEVDIEADRDDRSHACGRYNREKVLIAVHPQHEDIWYWLIPFSDGRCSLGVVFPRGFGDVDHRNSEIDNSAVLKEYIQQEPNLRDLLAHAHFDTPTRKMESYSATVSQLYGEPYALLGNAGEFLDPVFSSGVTIAMKSACLAADCVDRQLRGQEVDWQADFADALEIGTATFRSLVHAWYDGRFQEILFQENKSESVQKMLNSILAGYAWDQNNPFVKNCERHLQTLVELCRA